jgi:hypothetical protein
MRCTNVISESVSEMLSSFYIDIISTMVEYGKCRLCENILVTRDQRNIVRNKFIVLFLKASARC